MIAIPVALLSLTLTTAPCDGAASASELTRTLDLHFRSVGAMTMRNRQSLYMEGVIHAQVDLPVRVYLRRPSLLRQEIDMGGSLQVRVLSRSGGWQINPTAADTIALEGDALERVRRMAVLDDALLIAKQSGTQMCLLPPDSAGGAARVLVVASDGSITRHSLDPESGYEIRREWEDGGQAIDVTYQDFRLVEGVPRPHLLIQRTSGGEVRIAYTTVKFDIPMAESLFPPLRTPKVQDRKE